MRAPAVASEGDLSMYEPIFGLFVAALLGVYLVYTLLHPEKF
jgi:K+-transporting ATPase KdpF subunit